MSAFKDRCAIYTSFGDKLVFHAQSTKCWVMTNVFIMDHPLGGMVCDQERMDGWTGRLG